MNRSKKPLFFFFFLLMGISLFSQDGTIRFDLDLKSLNDLSRMELLELAEEENLLAVDGLLSSVLHEDDHIVLSIINGKWQGTERIDIYQCEVVLQGEQWLNVFPERIPRDPGDEIIRVNSYLLVLGVISDVKTINNENFIEITATQVRDISN